MERKDSEVLNQSLCYTKQADHVLITYLLTDVVLKSTKVPGASQLFAVDLRIRSAKSCKASSDRFFSLSSDGFIETNAG